MHRFIFGLGNDHIYFVIIWLYYARIAYIMISCSSGLFLNSAKVLFTMTDAFCHSLCVCLMIIINHKVSRSTMNHTAFILGPTFTALCYNIVYITLWNQAKYNTSSSTFQQLVLTLSCEKKDMAWRFAIWVIWALRNLWSRYH